MTDLGDAIDKLGLAEPVKECLLAIAQEVELAWRDRVAETEAHVKALKRVIAHLTKEGCIMDAPDGPVCWCGEPSAIECGLCREHGTRASEVPD